MTGVTAAELGIGRLFNLIRDAVVAVALRMVVDQGGTIGLDSAPGRGTTVRYSVPAAPAVPAVPSGTVPTTPATT